MLAATEFVVISLDFGSILRHPGGSHAAMARVVMKNEKTANKQRRRNLEIISYPHVHEALTRGAEGCVVAHILERQPNFAAEAQVR